MILYTVPYCSTEACTQLHSYHTSLIHVACTIYCIMIPGTCTPHERYRALYTPYMIVRIPRLRLGDVLGAAAWFITADSLRSRCRRLNTPVIVTKGLLADGMVHTPALITHNYGIRIHCPHRWNRQRHLLRSRAHSFVCMETGLRA